ncbi:MAG: OmpA family protein [bacterium]
MNKTGAFALCGLLGVAGVSMSGCCVDVENRLNTCVTKLGRVLGATSKAARQGVELTQALADAKRELQQQRERSAFLTRRLEALGQKVGAVQSLSAKERARLASRLRETRERLAQMEADRQRALARLDKLRALLKKFQALIKSGKIKVKIRDGRMVVVLASKVLFDAGRTLIKPAGRNALAEITAVLKSVTDRKFQVAGHTDDKPMRWGRYRSNWELSTARAVAVVKLMVQRGMPGRQLSAAGYGQFSPTKENTNALNRAENRRIEIVLQPKLDELPNLQSLFEKTR